MFQVISNTTPVDSIEATPALIAQLTGISPRTLRKAVEAGFIPNLSMPTVVELGRLPMLTSVLTPTGAPIPLVRMGVQALENMHDPGHCPPRKFAGLGAAMTNDEFLASAVRWWNPAGRTRVLEAGYMLVVIGGLTVGLVGGIEDTVRVRDRLEYVGNGLRLIARVDDVLSRKVRVIEQRTATEDERAFAEQVLPTRSTTRGGGVIGVLDADLS